jgi:hypothetical protein
MSIEYYVGLPNLLDKFLVLNKNWKLLNKYDNQVGSTKNGILPDVFQWWRRVSHANSTWRFCTVTNDGCSMAKTITGNDYSRWKEKKIGWFRNILEGQAWCSWWVLAHRVTRSWVRSRLSAEFLRCGSLWHWSALFWFRNILLQNTKVDHQTQNRLRDREGSKLTYFREMGIQLSIKHRID